MPFIQFLTTPVRTGELQALGGAGADGDDEVGGGVGADVFDAVFIIGANETDGAGTNARSGAIDGELDGPFPDEPHFGVSVMMRGMRHGSGSESRFVHFERFAGGKPAFEDGAKFRGF